MPDDLWPQLDELARGRSVRVLTTIGWHRRSRDDAVERYGASTSRARKSLPSAVVPITLRGAGETMFWLPEVRTLVPGDRLLGDGDGGVRDLPRLVAPLPEGQHRRDGPARTARAAARPSRGARSDLAWRAGALAGGREALRRVLA